VTYDRVGLIGVVCLSTEAQQDVLAWQSICGFAGGAA
jgi:hypothetical protein